MNRYTLEHASFSVVTVNTGDDVAPIARFVTGDGAVVFMNVDQAREYRDDVDAALSDAGWARAGDLR